MSVSDRPSRPPQRRWLIPPGRLRVFFAAPRGAVFDYLADPRNRPEWQSSLRSVELADDGPPRVGARWADHTAIGVVFDLGIVEMRRPEWWVEEGGSGPFTARVELSFSVSSRPRLWEREPDPPKGTLVGCAVQVRGAGWARPLGGPATAMGYIAARSDLRRAARILENRAGGRGGVRSKGAS